MNGCLGEGCSILNDIDMNNLDKKPIAPSVIDYFGKIIQFLMSGISAEAKNKKLIEASIAGNLEKVRKLLAQGASANTSDPDGDTPIICAANSLHLGIIELLLANNANVNAINSRGYSALYIASTRGNEAIPIIELLLKSGANCSHFIPHGCEGAGATPLYAAAFYGNNSGIKCFLSNGASVLANLEDGSTMMHAAAVGGDQEIIKLFLDASVAIDTPNNDGRTPLHMASIVGNVITAAALLNHGAFIDRLDGSGGTPLMHAVFNKRGSLVELFLLRGANYKLLLNGLSLLHYAALEGFDDILLMLIHAGAQVDALSDEGRTPVEFALIKGHTDTVEILNAELHKQRVAANLVGEERYVTVWVTNGELHT